ncbi:MAG: hypothetical protein QOH12_421 [Solirubrobacteraceae bacterium]|nr:hypothetical protein [Solirubrobacteraceae bacterium]
MAFNSGDNVVAEVAGRRKRSQLGAMRPQRHGVIEEVLRGDPKPRYRIRWHSGEVTVFSPAEGALRPTPAPSADFQPAE